MISICIPLYNYHVIPLVSQLVDQVKTSDHSYEILVGDDASDPQFLEKNASLHEMTEVSYLIQSENKGRSAIRNLLADKAKGEYLLFMDADSRIVDSHFLDKYSTSCEGQKIVCGGTSYGKAPEKKELMLRYRFGVEREQHSVEARMNKPYRSFTAHNFCIERKTFLEVKFDEEIKLYGHEDTLLGLEMKKRGVEILHIDNPLEHIGLESTDVFLDKTNKGLDNLIQLIQDPTRKEVLLKEIKVLKVYLFFKKLGMGPLIKAWYSINKKKIMKSFRSADPNLNYLDLYKLNYLFRNN